MTTPRPSSTATVLAPTVGLLVVAALLWVLGREVPAAVALVSALVVPQLAALSPRAGRALARATHAIAHAVGIVLGAILLGPVFLLVLVPAGLVLRALGLDPLGPGRRGTRFGWWQSRGEATDRPRRPYALERRGGAAPERAPSGRGHVLRVVVAVVAVEALVVGGVLLWRDRTTPEAEFGGVSSGSAIESAALRDLEWAPDAYAEFGDLSRNGVYTPFYGFSLRDFEGEHVNVQHRERASYRTPLADEQDPVEVWFFGGSTMFGFDLQRDQHTIASEVVRLAEAEGVAVRARNFGAPGYVNYQETLLLAQLLTAGGRPDLVVFYDGINDKAMAMLNAYGGFAAQGEPGTLGVEQIRQALVDSGFVPGATADPASPLQDAPQLPAGELTLDDLVGDLIGVYQQGVELSQELAEQYDFTVVHFWQPDLYTRNPLDPAEEAMLDDLALDPFRYAAVTGLSDVLVEELPEGAVDISFALDDVDGPVFSDVAHINEVGGRAVAEAMWANGLGDEVRGVSEG